MKKLMYLVVLIAAAGILMSAAMPRKSAVLKAEKAQATSVKVNWVTWAEAQEKMKDEPRKVFVDVYTSWCGPCRVFAQRLKDPKIANYLNEKYYAIKFNAETPDTIVLNGITYTNPRYNPNSTRKGAHDLTYALKVSAYPTSIYFNEKFEVLTSVRGGIGKKDIDMILHYFGEESYESETYEEFQKTYKSPFGPQVQSTSTQKTTTTKTNPSKGGSSSSGTNK